LLDKVTFVKTIQRSYMRLLDVLIYLQECGSNAIFLNLPYLWTKS